MQEMSRSRAYGGRLASLGQTVTAVRRKIDNLPNPPAHIRFRDAISFPLLFSPPNMWSLRDYH
jgi:hypothetical protein